MGGGKEADVLLEELHRDFDRRACVVMRQRRARMAVAVFLGLLVILGVSFDCILSLLHVFYFSLTYFSYHYLFV